MQTMDEVLDNHTFRTFGIINEDVNAEYYLVVFYNYDKEALNIYICDIHSV